MASQAGCNYALCSLKAGPWQHLWGGLKELAWPALRRKVGGGFMWLLLTPLSDASALSPPAFTPEQLLKAGRRFATIYWTFATPQYPLWCPSLPGVWIQEPAGVGMMPRRFLITNVPLLLGSCRVPCLWGH